MLSLEPLGPTRSVQPDGVTWVAALSATKKAKASSLGASGTEPYVCVYVVTAVADDCQVATPSTATDAPSPDISATANFE